MKKDQKNKFKTPEGYFESFNERLMNRIEAKKDDSISEIIPKTDGFAVPKKYFEEVGQNIKQKIGHGPKVISLRSYRKFYYAAASIAALFVLVLAWNWDNTSEPIIGFEDLASAEIDSYFENNDLGLTSYELAEVIDVEEINVLDMTNEAIADEEILEYLDENVDEFDDLNLDYEDLE